MKLKIKSWKIITAKSRSWLLMIFYSVSLYILYFVFCGKLWWFRSNKYKQISDSRICPKPITGQKWTSRRQVDNNGLAPPIIIKKNSKSLNPGEIIGSNHPVFYYTGITTSCSRILMILYFFLKKQQQRAVKLLGFFQQDSTIVLHTYTAERTTHTSTIDPVIVTT